MHVVCEIVFSECMIMHLSLILQAAAKGSYTPLVDTLKQVDSVTKDDVVKVC